MTAHCASIGIGSNIGDAAANVRIAMEQLGDLGTVARQSSLYRTKPWGKLDQPDFVNAAALLETRLDPRALLRALKEIEQRLGRGSAERWGPRTIDLDLLAYDDLVIDEPDLHVPHPMLSQRAFVLVPLAEIDARYEAMRDALARSELATVAPLRASPRPESL